MDVLAQFLAARASPTSGSSSAGCPKHACMMVRTLCRHRFACVFWQRASVMLAEGLIDIRSGELVLLRVACRRAAAGICSGLQATSCRSLHCVWLTAAFEAQWTSWRDSAAYSFHGYGTRCLVRLLNMWRLLLLAVPCLSRGGWWCCACNCVLWLLSIYLHELFWCCAAAFQTPWLGLWVHLCTAW